MILKSGELSIPFFFVKGQVINILGFEYQKASVVTSQLCCFSPQSNQG